MKLILMALVCVLFTTNCSMIDEEIPSSNLQNEINNEIEVEDQIDKNFSFAARAPQSIVISDDVLKVQTLDNDLVITDVKIYDQSNVQKLQDTGCLSVECFVDEAKVSLVPNGQFTIQLTFYNTKTSVFSTQIDYLTIDRP